LAEGGDVAVCACAIDAQDVTAHRAAMTRNMDIKLLTNLENPPVDASES
jgi:hypothetical protein